MFCRRTSCRCLFALTAGPRTVGDPRCVGTLPLSDATSVCAGPATCVGAGNPKRHWAIPRDAERRSGRASATKHGPSRIVQFLWLRVLWLGKSAHQTDACLILRDPNQFATRRNNFHSTKALFRGFSVPSSVCFRSAAEARRMPILIVIVMWMSKTIHGTLYRLERTRVGVAIKPCGISVF